MYLITNFNVLMLYELIYIYIVYRCYLGIWTYIIDVYIGCPIKNEAIFEKATLLYW